MSFQTRWLVPCLAVAWMAAPAAVQAQGDPLWARKMFEVDKLDFGVVATGADVKKELRFTNKYVQPIHVLGLSTGCRCAQAKTDVRVLESGKTGVIEVSMDTRNFSRQRDSKIMITLSEPSTGSQATVEIPVSAYIRTDVVVNPGSANMGVVDLGQPREIMLSVAYAGRPDWSIQRVQATNPHIEATAVQTNRNGAGQVNYDVKVTLKATAPQGVIRDTLLLITDDANNPQVPIAFAAQVESDITVTPANVDFKSVLAGQSKTQTVLIRGRQPIVIESFSRNKEDSALTTVKPTDARQAHALPLKFTAPEAAGVYEDEISIKIEGRKEPVLIRVQASVTAPAQPATAPPAETGTEAK